VPTKLPADWQQIKTIICKKFWEFGSGNLTTNCAAKLDASMKTDDTEQILKDNRCVHRPGQTEHQCGQNDWSLQHSWMTKVN
jgi:hypothetical protein